MASATRYEVEVTISSAKNLKNINWRSGDLKPYAVVWVDPRSKCSSKVDDSGDENPRWDETLIIPFYVPIQDAILHIDIVHDGIVEGTKPLVGSAKIPLHDIVNDVGIGGRSCPSLKLKRPSGRPQGKLEVKICVRELPFGPSDRYHAPSPYAYGFPPGSQDFQAPPLQPPPPPYATPPCGYPYNAPPPPPLPAAAPYGHDPYGKAAYGQMPYMQPPDYGQIPPSVYGHGSYGQREGKMGGKLGMGTGLAVGAAAGLLGGLALEEGADYVEDKIAGSAAEKVEEDLGFYDGVGDDELF